MPSCGRGASGWRARTPRPRPSAAGRLHRPLDIKGRTADTAPAPRKLCPDEGVLVEWSGATRPLDRIDRGRCPRLPPTLIAEKPDGKGSSDNTARRVCGRAKQFFRAAVRHKLISENPFGDMKCSIVENRERDRFITRQEAQAVLDACPDAQWRLLFALSRFGGLRCPSEHLGLRWGDVDWERSRITVHSARRRPHRARPSRMIPLFPELPPTWKPFGSRPSRAAVYIITRYREQNANLRTQLERIIRKAGLEPWPKLFQNLRAD